MSAFPGWLPRAPSWDCPRARSEPPAGSPENKHLRARSTPHRPRPWTGVARGACCHFQGLRFMRLHNPAKLQRVAPVSRGTDGRPRPRRVNSDQSESALNSDQSESALNSDQSESALNSDQSESALNSDQSESALLNSDQSELALARLHLCESRGDYRSWGAEVGTRPLGKMGR
jgi:hypothetical protein